MTGKTGTMRYMAPEVVRSEPHYDEKVDIYSMAMIFWYICHGVRPFEGVQPALVAGEDCLVLVRVCLLGLGTIFCSFVTVYEYTNAHSKALTHLRMLSAQISCLPLSQATCRTRSLSS